MGASQLGGIEVAEQDAGRREMAKREASRRPSTSRVARRLAGDGQQQLGRSAPVGAGVRR
jgi:hypothetical protein